MSGHTARVRAGNDRANLYTEITDKIIAELEVGRIPWVQPWGTAAIKAALAMPRNASTQRGYSGINVLILWGAVVEHGFSGQSWLTFRQALGLGGHVRKGERGTTVVYADRFTPDDERRRAAEAGEEPGAIPFLKRFTVRNTLAIICMRGGKLSAHRDCLDRLVVRLRADVSEAWCKIGA
jgi:antirestriction protein ArdC